jgi:integrase
MRDDNIMIDTQYLFQPRGRGTAWIFRIKTPAILVGKPNPRTGKPYKKEIREGLGATRSLVEARKIRDVLLGQIRLEEATLANAHDGTLGQALEIAESLKGVDLKAPDGVNEVVLEGMAEEIEKTQGTKKAKRWIKVASGQSTPLQVTYEKYLASGKGKSLAKSTRNDLKTVIKDFKEFLDGDDVGMEEVDRLMAGGFATEYLPNKPSAKSPNGPGPATVRKKITLLTSLWRWAMDRGYLEYSHMTPWDRQAPTKKEIKKAASKRRMFNPDETKALLKAAPIGKPLGDIIRVALLTGVRLEEVAALQASQFDEDGKGYEVKDGKTENATRYVPLTSLALKTLKPRLNKVKEDGLLFPELKVRSSTEKRGGAISQKFTDLRRDVLGDHTDGKLVLHSFRHTWRTAARRAGVDLLTTHEMGGWSRGNHSDDEYDHGDVREHYHREQRKVAQWLKREGFLG